MKVIKTKRLIGMLGCLLALVLTLSLAMPVMAMPQIPHAFYGSVTVGGEPALDGTVVSAEIGGVEYARTTTLDGKYGYSATFKVPGDDTETSDVEGGVEGDTIVFYIEGIEVDAYTFSNGEVTELPLEIEALPGPEPQPLSAEAGGPYSGKTGASIALSGSASGGTPPYTYAWDLDNDDQYDDATGATPSHSWATAGNYSIRLQVTDDVSATDTDTATVTVTTPPSGGGAAPPTYYTETTLFGTEESFRISRSGKILKTIEATSADGNLTITIPKDTIALDEDGDRLATLEVAVDESPPDPPEDTNIIGLAYDFGPDGATFDPAISLTWSYDPDALPGVDEEDLVLAYYDEEASEWVELDCVVDPVTHTITASVAHFTTFAIIGTVTEEEEVAPPPAPARFTIRSLGVSPSQVTPGEQVTISVLVANTGGESGSYQVTLVINDLVEATKDVTVRAGLSKEVTFSVTREEADTYEVTVDGRSGSFTVVPVVVPPEPAAFSVAYLSFSPLEVEPGEAVTVTVLVANIGGKSGSYNVVLKIDGVKEAEETVTIAAGESQEVSFSATKEEAGDYTVAVDGWSGSFTVVAPPEEEEEEEEVPTKPVLSWPFVGGIIGGVVVVAGLLYYFLVFRRR